MSRDGAEPAGEDDLFSEADAAVLRGALEGRPGWHELSRRLRERVNSSQSEGLGRLSLAFIYDLVAPSQDARRLTAGSPYASMVEGDQGSFPPRPPDIPDELWDTWTAARDAVQDPIVGARVNDLLYVARGRRAHESGRAAARDLLQLSELSSWEGLDRADALSRAMEIFTELRATDELAAAAARAIELVDELLTTQPHPGPPFILLRALLALKPALRPEMDDLMDRVIAGFGADGHAAEEAVALAVAATTDEERRDQLRRQRLNMRVAKAEAQTGLGRAIGLRRAIELAERYGFHEEAKALHKRQQDMSPDDLEMETFTSEVEVPTEAVQGQIDLFVGSRAADIFDALARLGQFPPPGGSHDDLDAEVAEQNRQFPIANLFGETLFGRGSAAPIFIANTEEAKRLMQRGRARRMHADFYGSVLLAPMLHAAPEHHGRPSHDELVEYFTTDFISSAQAERVARALELFWDGQFDDSAHVLVPRLEAIVRQVARHAGVTILKVAQEGRFGGYISLGTALAKLSELVGRGPWIDYLDALLCDPLAMNLRNDIAHGVIDGVGASDAALLLHAACHLRLWGIPSAATRSS